MRLRPVADPGAVIAAEIANNHLAQTKGRIAAIRATAADTAVMFGPQPVNAQVWSKTRPDTQPGLTWQPHQVWSSCDGTLALVKGAWQRGDGKTGYFAKVWQRQQDGGYKWVLEQSDMLEQPLAPPEMIEATVADCAGDSTPIAAPALPPGGVEGGGQSTDRSLYYRYVVAPSGDRTLTVSVRRDGVMHEVLRSIVHEGR